MGIRTTASDPKVALYDSVTDQAFGPVFDTAEEAELFLEWYQGKFGDPREVWWGGEPNDTVRFLRVHGDWHFATHDHTGFREDIAIQMAREVT